MDRCNRLETHKHFAWTGLMSHSSSHPCAWCDVSKENLTKNLSGTLRTFGNISELFWSWYDAGGDKSMAKHFGNVVHLPIMTCEPQTRILDVFPPPELHLLIGPVTLLYKGLQRIWKDGSEEWAK